MQCDWGRLLAALAGNVAAMLIGIGVAFSAHVLFLKRKE